MTSNILSIGKSALQAAQVGINTTGHNIANANVDGYSRQVVVQSASLATQTGFGYVGTGTQISEIKRVYSDFLGKQVVAAQSNSSSLDSYLTQINQVDNMLSDSTSGLTPALQDFFASVQDVSTNPVEARQAMLSSAQSLASRLQSMNGQLADIRTGINSQITASVTSINSYASQIATLNRTITTMSAGDTTPPNDLLDQRDQLVAQLSQETGVSVTLQSDNSYNVSIGSGQPLVVGSKAFQLAATPSSTDVTQMEVGYVTNGKVTPFSDSILTGGNLGGLISFRNNTLEPTQNALGRIALTIADSFNTQHKLGIDANGNPGTDFFNEASPVVTSSTLNNAASTAKTTASISNASALTTSDYLVRYDGNPPAYNVTRLSDGTKVPMVAQVGPPPSSTLTMDGVDFSVDNGASSVGDEFLVRPTIEGASTFTVKISDRALIAAAAPITTGSATTNTGAASISAGSVSTGFVSSSVSPAVTMTYDNTTDPANPAFNITMPTALPVDVTVNGTTTTYPAGQPVPYTDGATISFGNVSFQITGAPANGDTFTIGANTSGIGDNRNALLLAGLQTKNTMDAIGGQAATTTFQGAYAAIVSDIGNKTRELQVTGAAGDTLLAQDQASQQSVSGVNLDEEAANLIRYQQAYQAAGKVMQIASQMFATLLTLSS